MKKAIALLLIISLSFSICSCGKSDATVTTTAPTTDSPATTTDTSEDVSTEQLILKDAIGEQNTLFDSNYIEISVHSDQSYYFTNRNAEFWSDLLTFLEKSNTVIKTDSPYDTEIFYYYINISDYTSSLPISIYKNDIISINHGTEYYCPGIYEEFKAVLKPHLDEYSKYCKSGETKVRLQHEYVIFDENDDLLESDSIGGTPHIFYRDGIVHFWVQGGTGCLTRGTYFYDVETGKKSPRYSGQTDFYKNVVISVWHSGVYFYDMFTGEELYVINEFEKPLLDGMENVVSAYFTLDGTQVVVKYLNTDCHTETQIFDFPQELYTD